MSRRAELRVVSRAGTATWYLRGTVGKVSVFKSAETSDRKLAEEKCRVLAAQLYREALHGPAPEKPKEHTFGDALLGYLTSEPRPPATKKLLTKIASYLGDMPLSSINQLVVDGAYKAILEPDASGATRLRSVLTPLRAVLRHAARRGMGSVPMLETPKVRKVRMPFLRPDQAAAVVRSAAPHLRPLLVVGFAIGARPSELLELDWRDVDMRGGRIRLLQKQGTTREADLPRVAILALESIKQRDGAVFRPARHNKKDLDGVKCGYRSTGRSGGGQFKTAWASAAHRAGLPGEERLWRRKDRAGKFVRRFAPDHTPYVTRHSWASWHYCVHKDLLLLERDGHWEKGDMPRKYAKLMPDAYRQEILDWWAGRIDLGLPKADPEQAVRAA